MKRLIVALTLTALPLFSQVTNPYTHVYGETPGGTLDGVNTNFTLQYTPAIPTSVEVFRNGVRENNGTDYNLAGNTITFVSGSVPQPGDLLVADYVAGNAAMLTANNLSDIASVPAARQNLGLGSAATQDASAFDPAGAAAAAQTASLPATTILPANTGATAHQFFTAYNPGTGAFTTAQPDASDLTGLAPSATIDTTNASNVSTGTLAIARGGTGASSASAALAALGGGSLTANNTWSGNQTITGTVTASTIKSSGAITANVRTVTASNTGTTSDHTIILSGSSITETLPASPLKGQELYLTNIASTNATISGNGKSIWSAGTNYSSISLASNATAILLYDGSLWRQMK